VKKTNYIIIGIIFLSAIGTLIWGINYLKGINFFHKDNFYYVVYPNVSGLKVSNPGTINGYHVGIVKNVKLRPDYKGVVVTLSIKPDFPIPDSSTANITSIDIMGTKAVQIILSDKPTYAKSGDTLIGQTEKDLKDQVNAELIPLKKKTEDLLASFDSALAIVQNVFNEKTRKNLSISFESLKHTVVSLERTMITVDTLVSTEKSHIKRIVENINSIAENLQNNNGKIDTILANFSNISDTLAKINFVKTIDETNKAIQEADLFFKKINDGEGTLGQLAKNDTLYQRLDKASVDLDFLLKDIKENPKRYLHFSVFDLGRTTVIKQAK